VTRGVTDGGKGSPDGCQGAAAVYDVLSVTGIARTTRSGNGMQGRGAIHRMALQSVYFVGYRCGHSQAGKPAPMAACDVGHSSTWPPQMRIPFEYQLAQCQISGVVTSSCQATGMSAGERGYSGLQL